MSQNDYIIDNMPVPVARNECPRHLITGDEQIGVAYYSIPGRFHLAPDSLPQQRVDPVDLAEAIDLVFSGRTGAEMARTVASGTTAPGGPTTSSVAIMACDAGAVIVEVDAAKAKADRIWAALRSVI